MLTYCSGTWPGGHPDMLEAATSALPTGVFQQAMHWISVAHSKAYDYIHELRSIFVRGFRIYGKFQPYHSSATRFFPPSHPFSFSRLNI